MMKQKKPFYVNRFHLEFQVKHTVSSHFTGDAYDWIELYFISRPRDYRTLSIVSKRIMNLRMAQECILKSMLIALSKKNETAEEAYKSCKGCGHNLERLVIQCKQRSQNRFRICTKPGFVRIQKMTQFHIGLRYDIDLKDEYRKKDFGSRATLTGGVSGILSDDDFHKNILKDLSYMLRQNRRICQRRFLKHRCLRMSKYGEIIKYINKLIK
jgi:hypothetical protein